MNKSTRALIGFIFGFLLVIGACATKFPNPFAPGSILAGCLFGGIFAILGALLGGDSKNEKMND